jgi:hypothetical protein
VLACLYHRNLGSGRHSEVLQTKDHDIFSFVVNTSFMLGVIVVLLTGTETTFKRNNSNECKYI